MVFRKMLGWDKPIRSEQPEDDITELLVMIRRRSGGTNALEAPKRLMPTNCPKN